MEFKRPSYPLNNPHLEKYLREQEEKSAKRRAKEEARAKVYEERLRFRQMTREERNQVRREALARKQGQEMGKIEKQWAKRFEREKLIVEMREQGATLQEIGDAMRPRVTRERVRQILSEFERTTGRTISIPFRVPDLVILNCRVCNEEIAVRPSEFRGYGAHACGLHLYKRTSKYLKPDGTPMTRTEIARWRYHNVPGEKRRIMTHSYEWKKKKIASSPEYHEKVMNFHRKYREKNIEKLRAKSRAYSRQQAFKRRHNA